MRDTFNTTANQFVSEAENLKTIIHWKLQKSKRVELGPCAIITRLTNSGIEIQKNNFQITCLS